MYRIPIIDIVEKINQQSMVSYDLKFKESRLRLWKKTNQGYFAKIKQLKTKNKTNKKWGTNTSQDIKIYVDYIYKTDEKNTRTWFNANSLQVADTFDWSINSSLIEWVPEGLNSKFKNIYFVNRILPYPFCHIRRSFGNFSSKPISLHVADTYPVSQYIRG